jgi:hypothetical protein
MRVLPIAAVGALVAAGVFARVWLGDAQSSAPAIETNPDAIACPSGTGCISVGFSGSSFGVRVPFGAELADGAWSLQMPPAPSAVVDSLLSSVDCTGADACVAVGREDVPAPYLGARSAGDHPLIASWDGATWVRGSAPVPSGAKEARLNGVSCTGGMCMAVGQYGRTADRDRLLASLWDGETWKLLLPPRVRSSDDAALEGVDCVSATSCTAVGQFSYELQELFSGVAPLVERWDGTAWRTEVSDNARDSLDTELNAVSCPTLEVCVAVGFQRRTGGTYASFAEIREGGRWRVIPTPDPPGSPDVELADVACPAPDRCIAVGSWVTGGSVRSVVESWDGTRWRIEETPTPPDVTSVALTAIDCPSPETCVVVGTTEQGSPTRHALSLTRTNGGWTVLPMPEAVGTSFSPAGGLQSITASNAPSSTT